MININIRTLTCTGDVVDDPYDTGRYTFYKADISNRQQVQDLKSHVAERYKTVHVLVNNAGIANPYMPQGSGDAVDTFQKYIDVNLTGSVACFAYRQLATSNGHTGLSLTWLVGPLHVDGLTSACWS